jgi:hypothetical protein
MEGRGNWKEDFFEVLPVCEGVQQVVHVFVPWNGFPRAVPVGFPVTDEAIEAALRSRN